MAKHNAAGHAVNHRHADGIANPFAGARRVGPPKDGRVVGRVQVAVAHGNAVVEVDRLVGRHEGDGRELRPEARPRRPRRQVVGADAAFKGAEPLNDEQVAGLVNGNAAGARQARRGGKGAVAGGGDSAGVAVATRGAAHRRVFPGRGGGGPGDGGGGSGGHSGERRHRCGGERAPQRAAGGWHGGGRRGQGRRRSATGTCPSSAQRGKGGVEHRPRVRHAAVGVVGTAAPEVRAAPPLLWSRRSLGSGRRARRGQARKSSGGAQCRRWRGTGRRPAAGMRKAGHRLCGGGEWRGAPLEPPRTGVVAHAHWVTGLARCVRAARRSPCRPVGAGPPP